MTESQASCLVNAALLCAPMQTSFPLYNCMSLSLPYAVDLVLRTAVTRGIHSADVVRVLDGVVESRL